MRQSLTLRIRRLALALGLLGVIGGCSILGGSGDQSQTGQQWFTLKFTLGNVNQAVIEQVIVSIIQQKSDQYVGGVFQTMTGGSCGTVNGQACKVDLVDADNDADHLKDLVFTFGGNVFQGTGF